MSAVLITQCLQQDFVAPVGRYDQLPNLLHIGFEEARRLMGEVPAEGPVARVMRWAYQQPDARLQLIHIRDWHDAGDPEQKRHFEQFGEHCVKDTPGAAFVFEAPARAGKLVTLIDSPGLSDAWAAAWNVAALHGTFFVDAVVVVVVCGLATWVQLGVPAIAAWVSAALVSGPTIPSAFR